MTFPENKNKLQNQLPELATTSVIYQNISEETDEGPSPKLALSKGGSRGNIGS